MTPYSMAPSPFKAPQRAHLGETWTPTSTPEAGGGGVPPTGDYGPTAGALPVSGGGWSGGWQGSSQTDALPAMPAETYTGAVPVSGSAWSGGWQGPSLVASAKPQPPAWQPPMRRMAPQMPRWGMARRTLPQLALLQLLQGRR